MNKEDWGILLVVAAVLIFGCGGCRGCTITIVHKTEAVK